MEATKIYETSDSTSIRGKTIELLTEDLKKQRIRSDECRDWFVEIYRRSYQRTLGT
jgi:hypothetical protein